MGEKLKSQPWLTYLIILSCTIIYGMMAWEYQVTDFEASMIESWGGKKFPLMVFKGEWWRLISSVFLHANFEHLASNMICLGFIGYGLEPIVGRWRYLFIYIVSAIGGGLCGTLFSMDAISAGASGAIFGLFSVYIVLGAIFPKEERFKNRSLIMVVIVAYLMLGSMDSGEVSHFAHIGGAFYGMMATALVDIPRIRGLKWQYRLLIMGLMIGITVGILVLGTWVSRELYPNGWI